jgi:hypothetical protein
MLASAGSGPELPGAEAASAKLGSRWHPAAPRSVKNPSEKPKRNREPKLAIQRASSYLRMF